MDQASLNHFISKFPFRVVENSDPSKPPRLITCPCRLAFAHLAKPQVRTAQDTGEKFDEYTATLIVPEAVDTSLLVAVASKTAAQKFGERWASMELKNPLRPQAKNFGRYDGFGEKGIFIDTSSRFPIQVVGPKRINGAFPELKLDGVDVYSGMWVIAALEPYSYSNKTKGVKFGLRSLQKIADDEEFKGASASNDFADVDYSGVAAHSGNAGVSAPRGGAASNPFDNFA